ncbi:MAG: class I SAM-dependent methyltransferase [Deltaproteobacteria bacterium]|nr:MAG: class I SAM-dependent methyltransferase [Deltaproteobacteria bacterium]
MSELRARLLERLYPEARQRDPVIPFLELVDRYVTPTSRVLEFGAGAGERNVHHLKGRCAEIVGVDVDSRVRTNPLLDHGVVSDGVRLPFDDASFDVIFSIYVLEHIADPGAYAREVARVLKPGGVVLGLTPNKWHYVAAIASLTPTSFHRWVNARRGRPAEDTFPTTYRLNSRHDQERWLGPPSFRTAHFQRLEVAPNYLTFSVPTLLAGAAWERTVNATDALSRLRVVILSAFQRC